MKSVMQNEAPGSPELAILSFERGFHGDCLLLVLPLVPNQFTIGYAILQMAKSSIPILQIPIG